LRDKETRRPIGPVPARATRIEPGSASWDEATTALLAVRQNTPTGDRRAYWAEHCAVWSLELNPQSAPDDDPEDTAPDHAAPPTTESAAPD
jgi:hypothetical protein